ncbi:MAG TPA: DUF3857 domain-containing protein [Bacteroidales bacterium]|nr:DUF3857 domain-containing protein [Bacteroidales bacterium]HPS61594.1 DUF3857 domain-containing protein [Bacteroidales bacterium]
MKRICLLLSGIFLTLSRLGAASAPGYPVALIPNELLRNARMVIREQQYRMEVLGPSKYRENCRTVMTLLNSRAADLAELTVHYNSSSTVQEIKFRMYDEFGTDITRQFRNLEIRDESATPEGTLYSDYRMKHIAPVFSRYPVTVEYTYQVTHSETPFYPLWNPVTNENVSLDTARFELIFKENLRPRYRMLSGMPDPLETKEADQVKLTFAIGDLPALTEEPYSPPLHERAPSLLLAPVQFRINDYEGPFNTWADFGRFIGWLMKDRDRLPDETINKLREITRENHDIRSKARTIFRYMQSRTRYISVQVGIGGWQPVSAEYVDRKGYGDCKGLVNYTKALLSAVGIRSCYCLVYGGPEAPALDTGFPDNLFNHAILCIPDEPDTLWLECTSPTIPFGFLGSFTQGRPTLAITENGASLTTTPSYTPGDNSSVRTLQIRMDSVGNAGMSMKTINRCEQSEELESLAEISPAEQHNRFTRRIGISLSGITRLTYARQGDFVPEVSETAECSIPGFASTSEMRYHIPCVLDDRKLNVFTLDKERECDLVIRTSFTDIDTTDIEFPEGLSAEFLPSEQSLNTPYGQYHLAVNTHDNHIRITRLTILRSGHYSQADYIPFTEFLAQTRKNDNAKVVLIRKQ